MTIDTDSIFRYKIPDAQKLYDYGFSKCGKMMQKEVPIMKGQFRMLISIQPDNKVEYTVIDNEFGEEYILVNVESARGSFVGEVRIACETVLYDIAQKCFNTEVLKAEQTKRVFAVISSEYGIQPEFLWDRYPDYAVFRRPDNGKWFAIIMAVDQSRLGLPKHGNIEILNLKADPNLVTSLLKQNGFYPAYHMNKKHWFTLCLDGSIPDETVFSLLTSSYKCTAAPH